MDELELNNINYDAKKLKKLNNPDKPLVPINRRCEEFQRLMRSHPGFNRNELNGYLNLFSFLHNPTHDKYEKVEKLIGRILEKPNLFKYRN